MKDNSSSACLKLGLQDGIDCGTLGVQSMDHHGINCYTMGSSLWTTHQEPNTPQ